MSEQNGLSYEWLTATFQATRDATAFSETKWQVASRFDIGVATVLRVIELGDGEFMAECAQGERLDNVRYPSGVGIRLDSAEHIDQLVTAMRLTYIPKTDDMSQR